jgi:1,4-alpha-glucan branching enzyme
VRAGARAANRGPWGWLVTPRPVRIRPVWFAALAAAAALAVWLVAGRLAPRTTETASRAGTVADTVYVRFELVAPQARSVSVAGSFNGWQVGALPMTRVADGLWATTVALPVGEHRYEFVIDGTQWVPDPTAHVQVDDGFGGLNSVIVVGPKGLVRS